MIIPLKLLILLCGVCITNIDTVSQDAEALRPVEGDLAYLLFAAEIIGTGLLAVPVLAGPSAYILY